MLQTKENPIVGQFDSNYKYVEVKTASGTFHNVIETPPAAPVKPAGTHESEHAGQRTRAENIDILKKVTAKSNELFNRLGETNYIVEAKDIEKLSDSKLEELVKDLIKKRNSFTF